VAECFGSSVRIRAISSEIPASDAARASDMATGRTIVEIALAVCLSLRKRTRRTQDARIAGGRDRPVSEPAI
jgi:hypothetical protein